MDPHSKELARLVSDDPPRPMSVLDGLLGGGILVLGGLACWAVYELNSAMPQATSMALRKVAVGGSIAVAGVAMCGLAVLAQRVSDACAPRPDAPSDGVD